MAGSPRIREDNLPGLRVVADDHAHVAAACLLLKRWIFGEKTDLERPEQRDTRVDALANHRVKRRLGDRRADIFALEQLDETVAIPHRETGEAGFEKVVDRAEFFVDGERTRSPVRIRPRDLGELMHVAGDAVVFEKTLGRGHHAVALCPLIDHGNALDEDLVATALDLAGQLRELHRGTGTILHRGLVNAARIATGKSHTEKFGVARGLVIVLENGFAPRRDPDEALREHALSRPRLAAGRADVELLANVFAHRFETPIEVVELDATTVAAIKDRDRHAHESALFKIDDHLLDRHGAP